MKVLQVNDTYKGGGAAIVMQQLADALTLKGHEVQFAVGESNLANNVYRIPHFDGILFHLLRRLMFFNIDPLSYHYFKGFVVKVSPDVIHCHNLASRISPETVKTALKYRIPCVVSVHDYWPVCLNRMLLKGDEKKPDFEVCHETTWDNCGRECLWEAMKKWPNINWGMVNRRRLLLSKGVVVVAVSNYIKSVLERFGYPSDKIKVIQNGVDVNMFKPSLKNGEKLVLFIGGRLFGGERYKLKGIEHFVKVSKKIKENKPDVNFVHIGEEPVNAKNLVKSIGYVDHNEIVSYYQKATCLCIPTLLAPVFPTVALEAMACAKPVVAYNAGGISEIVKNGETGFLIEQANIDELKEKILYLLENENEAKRMGLNARKRVEEYYTLDRMCNEYLKLYKKMELL